MALGKDPVGCRVLMGQDAGITPKLSRVLLELQKLD